MQLRIIIAALTRNRVIGLDNSLPWNLSDDWERFKQRTAGKPFVMGRLSYESPHALISTQRNVILSRQQPYNLPAHCAWADSIPKAFELLADAPEVFVLGGAEVFQVAIPLCNRMYLTHIDADLKGDAFFPEFDRSAWKTTRTEHHPADPQHSYAFSFVDYEKV
jgi:dihydrofolate reductase